MKCNIGKTDVFYKTIGTGLPILMIHGYSLDHRVLLGCMEPIFARLPGYQRIYFDLPGMGQTPASDTIKHSQGMLDLVIKFVETILPATPFAVIGQSYGGYLARGVVHELAMRTAGMLLLCPVVDFPRCKRTVPSLKVLKHDTGLISELSMMDAEDFQSHVVLQTREVWHRFSKEILPGLHCADFSYLERIRDTEFSFDPDENAADYTKPVAMLLARYDNAVGYLDGLRLFKNYPSASLVVADNAGHNLQIEQEALFDTTVENWLQRMQFEQSI